MGQRMKDEPIEYGDDCLTGFDAGKTPKSVYVRFSGIVRCPASDYEPPNNRVFKLGQLALAPCEWFYMDDVWLVYFHILASPLRSWIHLHNDVDGLTDFWVTREAPVEEGFVYHNEIVGCEVWVGAKGGIAVVTWSPQATALLEAINLAKGNDLFMELFPLADGKLVYKFCRLKDATNIKILFEP